MHILDFLRDPNCNANSETTLFAEYRLLCSGTLYRSVNGDWAKSEVARMLLDSPLLLFVTNRPFDEYPLELLTQLKVRPVFESQEAASGSAMMSYYPDDEVAKDLASLLTLLCRRLVTVAGKSSEHYAHSPHPLFASHPFPLPTVMSMRRVYWARHPVMICSSLEGQELIDFNPQPKPVDAAYLTRMLLVLPSIEQARSLVIASRLYSAALELLHERPDVSYQLLISSIETVANAVFADFQPTEKEKVGHHNGLYRHALKLGLDEETATALAVEACKREWWATRKFKQFLVENTPASIWHESDELFHRMPQGISPSRDRFEDCLGRIYNARSKATHEGQAFPATASYTGGPSMPLRASVEFFNSNAPFPPVTWFERVVNGSLCSFWDRAVSAADSCSHTPEPQKSEST